MATPFTYSTIGFSGYSGYSGAGVSGYSGYSGANLSGYSGTSGYVAKWTSGSSQGNSIIQDNGTTVTVTGNLSATGNITVNGSGIFNKGVVASLIFGN